MNKAKKVKPVSIRSIRKTIETSLISPDQHDKLLHDIYRHIEEKEFSRVQKYIDSGFDINTKDSNGNSLLHVCIELDEITIRKLISFGIETNQKNKKGWTPLFLFRKYRDVTRKNKLLHDFLVNQGLVAMPNRFCDEWNINGG
jgi:ankyrin repeat protein